MPQKGLDGSGLSKGTIFLLRQVNDRVCPSSEAAGHCDSQNSVFEDNKLHPPCCWTSDFPFAGSLSSDLVKDSSQCNNQSIYLLLLKLGLGTLQNPEAEVKDLPHVLINLER